MKSLVTGATGFIGGRLVAKLLERGDEVTAVARSGNASLPRSVRIIKGDITDPGLTGAISGSFDRLYHLAAHISFNPKDSEVLAKNNVYGTENLLSIAGNKGIARTVFVSSACTIGLSYSERAVLDETSVPERSVVDANPYLKSKLLAESIAAAAAKTMHVTTVNPTTVYGPGDRTLNSGGIIKRVVTSRIVPVPTGGSNVTDVDDVADGILLAGEKGKPGRRYILGTNNLSFGDIFRGIASAAGVKPVFAPVPGWARGPLALSAGILNLFVGERFITPQIISDLFAFKFYSNRLAKEELGWSPKYSFGQSVSRALEYYHREGLL